MEPVTQENITLERLYAAFNPKRGLLGWAFGTKRRTKMVEFCSITGVTNDIIDGYMRMPPRRLEHETKEDLKLRSVFQKDLLKYRGLIYNR